MLNMTWTSPGKIAGTLRLKQDPFRYGLGHYEDEGGVLWDIAAVWCLRGVKWVNARRVSCHPSYYGTATGDTSAGFHRWEPYEVECAS